MRMKKIKRKIIFTLFVFLVCFSLGAAMKVTAGVDDNVSGWLWGGSEDANIGPIGILNDGNETGVGWISMNSTDCDTNSNGFFDIACGGDDITTTVVNYGVNIPTANGDLSGYAWSSNLGWISFNNTDCPAGIFSGCNARREGNNLAGYARIVDIKDALAVGNSGGWEGFIDLSGVSINPSTGDLSGYGWNGENNTDPSVAPNNVANGLGWIDFSGAKVSCIPDSVCSSHVITYGICSGTCGGGSGMKNGTCDDGCSGLGNAASVACVNNAPCPCICQNPENHCQRTTWADSCGVADACSNGTKDCSWQEVAP